MAETQQRVLIYDRIDANRRSTFLLLFVFVALLAGASIAMGIVLGLPYPFAPLLIIPFLVIALVGYYSSSRVALAISQAREVTEDGEPELFRTVENLCIGAGLPMPKVYVIEDGSPNAFATWCAVCPGLARRCSSTSSIETKSPARLRTIAPVARHAVFVLHPSGTLVFDAHVVVQGRQGLPAQPRRLLANVLLEQGVYPQIVEQAAHGPVGRLVRVDLAGRAAVDQLLSFPVRLILGLETIVETNDLLARVLQRPVEVGTTRA